jgi:hypothetical protein
MRWAGEALRWLGDNALTRGWSDAVTNVVIQPAEVAGAELARLVGAGAGSDAMVAQDTRVRLARRMAEEMAATGGTMSPETVKILREYVDPEFDVAGIQGKYPRYNQAGLGMDDRTVDLSNYLADLKYLPGTEERGDVVRQQTNQLRHAVLDGSARAYTVAGEPVRQYLIGSPLAAYAATGLGAGAVGLGLAELLSQLPADPQEAEPRAEAPARRKPEKEKEQR